MCSQQQPAALGQLSPHCRQRVRTEREVNGLAPKRIVLRFGKDISDKPIIYYLVKDYDLRINILKANVNPNKEGTLVLSLAGKTTTKESSF